MKIFIKRVLFFNFLKKVLFFFLKSFFFEIEKKVVRIEKRSKEKFNKLIIEHTNLKNEHSNLKNEHSNLKNEHSNLKNEHSNLKSDFLKRYEGVSKALKDFEKFKLEEKSSRIKINEDLISLGKSLSEFRKDLSEAQNLTKKIPEILKSRDGFKVYYETNKAKVHKELVHLKDLCSKLRANLISGEEKVSKIHENLSPLKPKLKLQEEAVACLYNNTLGVRDTYLEARKNSMRGKRCFLLGSGPSLNKVDLSLLKGESVMGVNGVIAKEGLNLDYFCTVSYTWWQHHQDILRGHKVKERLFVPNYITKNIALDDCTHLKVLENKYTQLYSDLTPLFFSEDPAQFVVTGGTVIFVSLQILNYLGFDEVVLLGIDHNYELANTSGIKKENGKIVKSRSIPHFSKDYYTSDIDIHMDLKAMERGYSLAREAFEKAGKKILNASLGTKLHVFEKVDFKSLFKKRRSKMRVKRKNHESGSISSSQRNQ